MLEFTSYNDMANTLGEYCTDHLIDYIMVQNRSSDLGSAQPRSSQAQMLGVIMTW